MFWQLLLFALVAVCFAGDSKSANMVDLGMGTPGTGQPYPHNHGYPSGYPQHGYPHHGLPHPPVPHPDHTTHSGAGYHHPPYGSPYGSYGSPYDHHYGNSYPNFHHDSHTRHYGGAKN
ncbi:Hypothetical predicted protein [Octopus vulgaris]|uniref:Uncharacterized protein n=1 Tax=Octopus vulgaris TaxID=6645 RepID=A0AA36MEW3_OCTVU|nr:Hypothetical predicted protein [Octopus vulgaris]